MLQKFVLLNFLGLLSACVTDTGPVPIGQGVYMMPNDGSGFQSGGGINAPNYQRAIKFCFEQGKQVVRVDAGGEFRFRCAGPGEPGWKQPAG